MEIVGGVAAIAELLSLSVKLSKATKNLTTSFLNAPIELFDLSAKVDLLHARINQYQSLCADLSTPDSIVLLPDEHRAVLKQHLQTNLATVQNLKDLSVMKSQGSPDVKGRLRWAALNKTKAARMIKDIKEAETHIDGVLRILNIRLSNLKYASLTNMGALQAARYEDLKQGLQDIKGLIQSELKTLIAQRALDNIQLPLPDTGTGVILESQEAPPGPARVRPMAIGICADSEAEQMVADPRMMLIQHDMRRTLTHYSTHFGHLMCPDDRPTIGGTITIDSKRNRRNFRLVLSIGFHFICRRILLFELQAHQMFQSWIYAPRFDCSVWGFNIRPSDAPIFKACRDWDFYQVRYLLESGQASIHDVDERVGGLLEHVLSESLHIEIFGEAAFKGQLLLEYILDQGCNPCAYYGDVHVRAVRRPAIVTAFDLGLTRAVSSLSIRGGDLLSFGPEIGGLFKRSNMPGLFRWKVEKLRSLRFSDWEDSSDWESNNLLYGACWECDLPEALFALEVVGISPNREGDLERTPLGNAAQAGWVQGCSVLIECGADVNCSQASWSGTPLTRSCHDPHTMHWLLKQGGDPRLTDSCARSTWVSFFKWHLANGQHTWSYYDVEGSLTHLLHHDADPFQLFITERDDQFVKTLLKSWFDLARQVRAVEVARAASYQCISMDLIGERASAFDSQEETQLPDFLSTWSDSGDIYMRLIDDEQRNITDSSPTGSGHSQRFYYEASRFHYHTSTEEGRTQLSRFPYVRVLCDALQHAGYRAEMDNDGDIWYDVDDGDRYFDALEDQLKDNLQHCQWLVETCPICQRMEWYGLGHVLREAEEGKRQLYEYREKLKERKVNYF